MKNKLNYGKRCIGQSVEDSNGNVGIITDMWTENGSKCLVKISYLDGVVQIREKFHVSRGSFRKPELDNIDALLSSNLWRRVYGYENYYIVNVYGDIIRTDGINKGRYKSGYIRNNGTGYVTVSLYTNSKKSRKIKFVHRIVAETFLRPISDGEEVNHIDGCKSNNALYNLEITSRKENNRKYLDIRKLGIDANKAERIKLYCSTRKINLYQFLQETINEFIQRN